MSSTHIRTNAPIRIKRINKSEYTALETPFLRREVHVLYAKFHLVSLGPLKVINDAPGQSADDVDALGDSHEDALHVVVILRILATWPSIILG